MEMMNISLPDDMKAFVEDQATLKGFGTLSEYIRAIIREVQETNAARERIDDLLLEGLDSGQGTPLVPVDWDRIPKTREKVDGEGKAQ